MCNGLKAVSSGRRVLIRLFLASLFLLLGLLADASGQFLYVNNGAANNSVSGFEIDPDGTLTPVPGSPFETGGVVGPLTDFSNATIHVNGDLVFACNLFSHTVSAFSIDGDGSLAPVEGSPFATGGRLPVAVITNRQGTFLIVVNYGSSDVGVFHIDSTGALSPVPGSPFTVRPLGQPTGLAINSAGTRLMIGGQGLLGVYDVHADGSLSQAGPLIETGLDTQALAMTSNDRYLYAAAVGADAISGWRISAADQLTPLPNSPYSLPSGSGALGLAINPRNNRLFATAPGESAVHVFRIASNGALRSVSGSPFSTDGSGLNAVGVDPSGDFLYAVDAANRLIHVFQINALVGRIAEIAASPFSTGAARGRPSALGFK